MLSQREMPTNNEHKQKQKLEKKGIAIMSLKRKATAAAVPSPESKIRQPKGGKNATGNEK